MKICVLVKEVPDAAVQNRIDPSTGLCVGCARTLQEIASWGTLDDDARRVVWEAIAARRANEP